MTCAAQRSCARDLPADWLEIDSSEIDTSGRIDPPADPYAGQAVC